VNYTVIHPSRPIQPASIIVSPSMAAEWRRIMGPPQRTAPTPKPPRPMVELRDYTRPSKPSDYGPLTYRSTTASYSNMPSATITPSLEGLDYIGESMWQQMRADQMEHGDIPEFFRRRGAHSVAIPRDHVWFSFEDRPQNSQPWRGLFPSETHPAATFPDDDGDEEYDA